MATRKVRIQEKTSANTIDVLHPETSADLVSYEAGSSTGHLTSNNVQDAVDELRDKINGIGSTVVNTLNSKTGDVLLEGTGNISVSTDPENSQKIVVSTTAEVNQNAYGKFQTNSSSEVTAGSKTATMKFVDGTNINVSTTANNEIQIATTPDVVTKSENGTADKLVAFSGTNTIKNGPDYGTTGANKLLQLDSSGKITLSTLPDAILGQLVYGGNVTGAGVATLSTNAKSKLGTSSDSITLTNDTTAITGYVANEGIFYIVSSDGNFASLGLLVGDWLISTGSAWNKIDNTDAVTGVKGDKESSYRIGNVNLTPANIGALPDTTHIPTDPNNATITLQRNGITAGDFTVDQSSNETINISEYIGGTSSAPTNIWELPEGHYVLQSGRYISVNDGTHASTLTYEIGSIDIPVEISRYVDGSELRVIGSFGISNGVIGTGGPTILRLFYYSNTMQSDELPFTTRYVNGQKHGTSGIYAPTSAGTSGQYLKSSGAGNAPVWDNLPTVTVTDSGSGNFVKDVTNSGNALTVTKGNISNSDLPDSGVTAGTYSAVAVNSKGVATAGYQSLEYGSKSGTNTPSSNLVIGGLFFEEL